MPESEDMELLFSFLAHATPWFGQYGRFLKSVIVNIINKYILWIANYNENRALHVTIMCIIESRMIVGMLPKQKHNKLTIKSICVRTFQIR